MFQKLFPLIGWQQGFSGREKQSVWHMPENAILIGKSKDNLDENAHHWAKKGWKYLLRKQVIKMACTQIGRCTKWPPEATE